MRSQIEFNQYQKSNADRFLLLLGIKHSNYRGRTAAAHPMSIQLCQIGTNSGNKIIKAVMGSKCDKFLQPWEANSTFLIASPEPWDVAAPMEKRKPQISASDPQQLNAKTDLFRQHLSILLLTFGEE
jgi:hypothetical protein